VSPFFSDQGKNPEGRGSKRCHLLRICTGLGAGNQGGARLEGNADEKKSNQHAGSLFHTHPRAREGQMSERTTKEGKRQERVVEKGLLSRGSMGRACFRRGGQKKNRFSFTVTTKRHTCSGPKAEGTVRSKKERPSVHDQRAHTLWSGRG